MFGLLDINNFYASCERVFNPRLQQLPVLVLSNNDGCVIARSNEVRALGIKMGQPYFEVRRLCETNNVQIFSSNYTLYGDMSHRVMSIIEESWPDIEIYSIDEAFLELKQINPLQIQLLGLTLHKKILQYTGLPSSIGVGATKTLAKLANYIAKRELKTPFFDITDNADFWLKQIDVSEVWGVGRQLTKRFKGMGIKSAYDLRKTNPMLMRKKFNLMVMRTVLELQGQSCLPLEDVAPKKGIMSSKSFGTMQTEYAPIDEALANFCSRASKKLREQQSSAGRLSVFIRTNPFREDLPQYSASTDVNLINATNDVRVLTHWAKRCLKQLYKKGFHYKKVGVYLEDIRPQNAHQIDLFNDVSEYERHKSSNLMKMLDNINARYGKGTLKLAAEGFARSWDMKQCLKSPCYTTQWTDLPTVKI